MQNYTQITVIRQDKNFVEDQNENDFAIPTQCMQLPSPQAMTNYSSLFFIIWGVFWKTAEKPGLPVELGHDDDDVDDDDFDDVGDDDDV